jgi:hypothetical protein
MRFTLSERAIYGGCSVYSVYKRPFGGMFRAL